MLKEEAKRFVLAKWRALPPEDRRTDGQAATFAMKLTNEVHFRASGDPYQVIKGWLLNNLARD